MSRHVSASKAKPFSVALLELLGAHYPWCRLVAVWKFAFDESGPKGNVGWFISAGVVAKQSQWRSLEAAWKKTMRAKPAIDAFHYNHLWRRKISGTCFYGWTKREAELKVQALSRLVAKHTRKRILVAFREEHAQCALRNSPLEKIYMASNVFSFFASLQASAGLMSRLPQPQKKPVLFFDKWSDSKKENAAMQIFQDLAEAKPEDGALYEIGRWLQRQPIFHDDEKEVCLQVADLVAGRWRHTLESASRKGAQPSIPKDLGREIVNYYWPTIDNALRFKWALVRYLNKKKDGDN